MTTTNNCPRLIEVALPIREISAESVRDKNIHHAHISHLHIWWARRPLAAARAIIFASLVPDPDDLRCPPEFRALVEKLLKTDVPSILRQRYDKRMKSAVSDDPYRPYSGIPDTLRNRLLTFIGKWSPEWQKFELGLHDKQPPPAELLDDRSLVKWETSDPANPQGREVLRIAREFIRVAHGGAMPSVLDPFTGGGAIPLEAERLGTQPIANDYNPVAHLIQRATCEFPQKFGRPGKRLVQRQGQKQEIQVPNVLVHDVESWANWILARARAKIGHLYKSGKDGFPVVAYLWSRTVPCSNPSCKGELPLIRSLLLCDKPGKKIALTMEVDKPSKKVSFGVAKGSDIKRTEGTKKQRGPAICPFCEQPTSEEAIRDAGSTKSMRTRMIAVVVDTPRGKQYRPVEDTELQHFEDAKKTPAEIPNEYIVPEINGPTASKLAGAHRSINLELYGFTRWGQLFNHRQLVAIHTFVELLHEARIAMLKEGYEADYSEALTIYLALWIDRIAVFSNTMCRWAPGSEIIKTPFGGQSIPMMWDFPEVNPFAETSGSASTQLDYMVKVIQHESPPKDVVIQTPLFFIASASKLSLNSDSCDLVVTDPPYGNSIAYADLSDFFYVWLKRSLGDVLPNMFTTPQTPKDKEATSHKHRHEGSQARANTHYRGLLTEAFTECLRVTKHPKLISVMFAHQSTEAWTALISAMFDSGLCPTATWPIATEMPNTALALGTASLETSVTVVCHPRVIGNAASLRTVRREIEKAVAEAVKRFWAYGFRGADLLVACYGPAVGVFGKYERVEKADGTPVEVPELLELAREAARNAIAGEFDGDDLSTLYYVWANLYGAAEQSWDDARLVVQIGGERADAMEVARRSGIFVIDGNQCRLALLGARAGRRDLGEDPTGPLIDTLHRAMLYWKQEDRNGLLRYLVARDLLTNDPFWKLAQALFDTMPRDTEDWKITSALLSERETLRMQAKGIGGTRPMQSTFDME